MSTCRWRSQEQGLGPLRPSVLYCTCRFLKILNPHTFRAHWLPMLGDYTPGVFPGIHSRDEGASPTQLLLLRSSTLHSFLGTTAPANSGSQTPAVGPVFFSASWGQSLNMDTLARSDFNLRFSQASVSELISFLRGWSCGPVSRRSESGEGAGFSLASPACVTLN